MNQPNVLQFKIHSRYNYLFIIDLKYFDSVTTSNVLGRGTKSETRDESWKQRLEHVFLVQPWGLCGIGCMMCDILP